MTHKVVVSLLTEEQEFQQMQAADARETASRLGLEVEVLFAENNAVQCCKRCSRAGRLRANGLKH